MKPATRQLLTSTLRLIPYWAVLSCLTSAAPVASRGQEPAFPEGDPKQLAAEWNQAYKGKDWERAIEVGLTLTRLVPNNATHRYNLACAYSLKGDVENALIWLGKAVERGFDQVKRFETDSDLANLRELDEYRTSLDLVKKNYEEGLTRLRKKFRRRRPLIYTPPDHDRNRPAPLILALHGYGAIGKRLAAQWKPVAGEIGAILVAPDAVRRVKGTYGFNWGDIDEADLLVHLTLDYVKERHKIDESRIVLTGFSQGAYIAFAMGVRHPDMFIGVIPVACPYIPSIDAPARASGDRLPRYYFMVGEKDSVIEQCRMAAKDFAAAGYAVKFRVFPAVGHAFPLKPNEELREALAYVLRR